MDLSEYTISDGSSIISAFKMIDKNKKGFLIVTDVNGKVNGTLTDGDIRRALIRGFMPDDAIDDVYCRDFTFLKDGDDPYSSIDLFKDEKIDFIPVLDSDNKLVSVITKKALHALLLENTNFDLTYDFMSVDSNVVDYEVFSRPWGIYKTTVLNDMFQSKVISVKPLQSLSYQYHKRREEHWIIINGTGDVRLDDSIMHVSGGSTIFIPKGCKHRITNTDPENTLIFVEVQLGNYFGEDDIIRIEDNYGRA